jgi:hypothetical protein
MIEAAHPGDAILRLIATIRAPRGHHGTRKRCIAAIE